MFRVLRRRWRLIALCTLAVAGAALAVSLSKEKEYEATASLLFRDAGLEETLFGSSSGSGDPEREVATNVELGAVEVVAARTAAKLRVPGLDAAEVASQVDVSANRDSDLASVTATTRDPRLASRMANVFAEQYIAFRRSADRARVRGALLGVRRQIAGLTPTEQAGAEGRRLRREAQRLEILATLRTGNVELVDKAQADDQPVSPRPRRNTAVGLILGFMIGLALTFLLEQIDRRLRDPEDVEEAFGLPTLARIPESRAIRRTRSRKALALPPPEAEAFRMLRANLRYFNVDREIESLLVTSARRGEGKSTVAWNLALAEAQTGRSVLLIEADLRRPQLADALDFPREQGLSLLLAGVSDGGEASISLSTGGAMLDVIPAGPAPPNPAQLLESGRMAELLETAQGRYDLVVIDTPPALAVSDVTPLLSRMSGVLVVTRLGHCRREEAEGLLEQLRVGGGRVLGVVINGDQGRHGEYAGYGATGDKGVPAARAAAPSGR